MREEKLERSAEVGSPPGDVGGGRRDARSSREIRTSRKGQKRSKRRRVTEGRVVGKRRRGRKR